MKRFLTKDSTLALATWLLLVVGAGQYIADHHEQLGEGVVEGSVSETVIRYQELECGSAANAGDCGGGNTAAPALNIPLDLGR
jgi:hypothetical protein